MMAAERLSTSWRLAGLLDGFVEVPAALDVPVTGISADSRSVEPGQVFIARRGSASDGARFVGDAAAAGAVAVVRQGEPGCRQGEGGLVQVQVADVVACTAVMAGRFYDHPSLHVAVLGITGTNGKTSVAHFLAQALSAGQAQACGVLGTLGYGVHGALRPARLTTPDAIGVQSELAALRAAGVGRAVMEVSSHALDQGRVAGVHFQGAVFTNLTRDHLDYHGDMQRYGDAKARLFDVDGLRHAAINEDDTFGAALLARRRAGVHTVAYGLERHRQALPVGGDPARLRARVEHSGEAAMTLFIRGSFGEARLASGLVGRFNAYNLLAALAALLGMGWELAPAVERLATVNAPAGRMQRFGGGVHEPLVVVDYSHTPDSLTRALESLRPLCRGALWCVFGAGGDRDPGKRPMMGAAAAAHADVIVITDDNPRGEDGDVIVENVRAGIPPHLEPRIQRDRAKAIALAVAEAGPGDVVLVAGKGHEPYQEIAGRRLPFSDAAAVRAALGARRG